MYYLSLFCFFTSDHLLTFRFYSYLFFSDYAWCSCSWLDLSPFTFLNLLIIPSPVYGGLVFFFLFFLFFFFFSFSFFACCLLMMNWWSMNALNDWCTRRMFGPPGQPGQNREPGRMDLRNGWMINAGACIMTILYYLGSIRWLMNGMIYWCFEQALPRLEFEFESPKAYY